jgi:hypothetical protein
LCQPPLFSSKAPCHSAKVGDIPLQQSEALASWARRSVVFNNYDCCEMSSYTMLARTGPPTVNERIVHQRMPTDNRELPGRRLA